MNFIFSKEILVVMLVIMIFLIIFRKHDVGKKLLTFFSLFLAPFIIYKYPGAIGNLVMFIISPIKSGLLYDVVIDFLVVVILTIIVGYVIIKINIKPFSIRTTDTLELKDYNNLKIGQRLLNYTIWYTLYVSLFHLPVCLAIMLISSLSIRSVMLAPMALFVLLCSYGLALIMSINGLFRVRGKHGFKILILMFIPIINFLMMIKLSFEAKKRLKLLSETP